MKQKILERIGYSEHIERMFGRGMMIALTGQRRVGKSCVMRRILDHIAENKDNHVIYIDKEKTSFDMIANYQDLEAYVAANIIEGKENYLFIDEVQEISDFEKALLSIQSDDTCQIMIIGSNAKMLSGELATRLRGRYIAYRIRGLCYEEFLSFHELKDDDASLNLYLQYGGLPQLRSLGLENTDLVEDYLDNVYNTIVLRDIIGGNRRFDIEKVMENAVYIHLCRIGYKVYVGQMYKAEIDFVAEKADSVAYVQVTYLLASEETVEREFGNLKLIKDSHPKYVISMDKLYGQTNIDGIKHIHLRDFLKMTTLV